jgi:hypothetical protein
MLHSVPAPPAFLSVLARRLWPWHRWLLLALWLLVQALVLHKYHGPHYANDSWRYLDYAKNIVERGYFEPGHNVRYILYPLFISCWFWLKTGWWGIVLGQVALSGLAAAALYRGTRQVAGGQRGPAALATLLFISWLDIQNFNAFLLTESLFTSLSVLSFGALANLRGWAGSVGAWVLLLTVLTLTALARPNGFVVPLAAGLAGLLMLARLRNQRPFRAALLGLVLLAPVLWVALNHQLQTFTLIETYQRGELIFRYPWRAVHPDGPFQLPPPGLAPVPRLLYFYAHNPGFMLRLMLGKLLVYVSYLKPHYSLAHKALATAVVWPSYALAARAVWRGCGWRPVRLFLALVPLLQTLVVTLTVDDWDVRFLAPVLPFVFVLAALGLYSVNRVHQAAG